MKINNIMAESVVRGSVCQSPQISSTNNTSTSGQQQQQQTNSVTRLQQLKQRKLELDKLLNEKINLLHQLCKQEAQLGVIKNGYDTDSLNNLTTTTIGIDENLNFFDHLNVKEETNKELLSIHHLNNESSNKLASNSTNTTALHGRRGQKCFDSGNQKYGNQSTNVLRKKPNYLSPSNPTGEFSNKKPTSISNAINSSAITTTPTTITTAVVPPIPMERRNSLLLKNSTQRPVYTIGKSHPPPPPPLPPPPQSTHIHPDINDNEFSHNTNGLKSKTMPYHYHQTTQHYLHHQHDSAQSIYTGHHTYQHVGIKKSLSMRSPDTTELPIFDYPVPIVHTSPNSMVQNQIRYTSDDTIIVSYGNFNNNDYTRPYEGVKQQQQQQQAINETLHLTYHTPQPEYFYHHSMQHQQQLDTKSYSPNHSTRKYHSQRSMYKKSSSHDDVYDDDYHHHHYHHHNADIVSLTPTLPLHNNQLQPSFIIVDQQPQQQGLGGYWHTLENNERVWCSVDSRFASLDRKGQQKLLQKQLNGEIQQPSKSISLGNIDVATKNDKQFDTMSITSLTIENTKKSKEKQWLETPVDTPSNKHTKSSINYHHHHHHHQHQQQQQHQLPPKHQSNPMQSFIMHEDNISVQTTPPGYFREKKKLSSQSMHSPGGRSIAITATTTTAASSLNSMDKLNAQLMPIGQTSSDYLEHTKYPIKISDYHQSPTIPIDIYDQQSIYHNSYNNNNNNQQSVMMSPSSQSSYGIINTSANLRRTASCVSSASTTPITVSPLTGNVTGAFTISCGGTSSPSSSQEYNPATYNLVNRAVDIRTESPKNMTIVQQAKFQPYKEVTKPFEMSDFYKYSTKFRQKCHGSSIGTNTIIASSNNNNNTIVDNDPSM